MNKPMRPLEMAVNRSDGTWYAGVFVEVPNDTPDDKLLEVATKLVSSHPTLYDVAVVNIWIYNSMEDERPENESDSEAIMRLSSVVDDSPIIKLIIALLDDEHGITSEAFDFLREFVLTTLLNNRNGLSHADSARIKSIFLQVDGVEGRMYLPQGVDHA